MHCAHYRCDALFTVGDAKWPAFTPYNRQVRKEYLFFRDFLKNIRLTALKLKVPAPKCAYVYLAVTYEEKKVEVLRYMQMQCDPEGRFAADFLKEFKAYLESNEQLKGETKVGSCGLCSCLVKHVIFYSLLLTEPDAVRRVYA